VITIGRAHQISITAVALVGVMGVLSGSSFLLYSGLAITLAILLSARRFHRDKHARSKVVLVHLFTLLGLVYAVLSFRSSRIDAVLFVLMLGLFNRFVLRLGRRDDFIVLGSASVLFAAATTVTPGFEFALLLLLFVPTTLLCMWMTTIVGMSETSTDLKSDAVLNTKAVLLSTPCPKGARRLALFGIIFTLLGFASVSILPRYTFLPMFGAGGLTQFGGAPDSMELTAGGVSDVSSNAVVLRVESLKPGDRDQFPGLYARMYALDEFDGRRWRSTGSGAFRVQNRPAATLTAIQPLRVKVRRSRSGVRQPVPQLGRSNAVLLRSGRIYEDLSGSWSSLFTGLELEYELDLAREADLPKLPGALRSARDRHLRHVPSDLNPRIPALARELTKEAKDDWAKVKAILVHFDRGFSYSLDSLGGDDADPLSQFLFEAKRGHCELYAGAVAILLRTVGLKTRVASGFYGGHYNELGSYLGFSGANAHAWVEVWVEGRGWRWIDATPEDQRWRQTDSTVFSKLTDFYEALDRLWFDHVVDYESQYSVLALAKGLSRWAHEGTPPWETTSASFHDDDEGRPFMYLLMVFVILGTVCFAILQWRRRSASLRRLGKRLRELLHAKGRSVDTLEGLLAHVPPNASVLAGQAVDEYQCLRFAADLPDHELQKRARMLKSQLDHLHQSLRVN
jgi:transglutaminase-like putative cysteine protease